MRRELTSPTLSFPCESSFSRGRVFSFLPRRGTPPRARESHPPRVNSARTRRALDGRVLTRPELRGKNESGTGTRFRTSTNHQSLLLSSFSSAYSATRVSRFSVLSSSVTASAAGSNPLRLRSTQMFYHFDFNGTFPITTTPVRFTRPEVHTLPTFPERRSSWPQRDGRSTTLPRSSTTTRPPLSHTHSLSLYLSLFPSFSRPSWPSSRLSSHPRQHFHHRRLRSPTLCPLAHPCHANNLCPPHR